MILLFHIRKVKRERGGKLDKGLGVVSQCAFYPAWLFVPWNTAFPFHISLAAYNHRSIPMSTYKNPSFNDPTPTTDSILSLCSQGSHRLLDFQWRFAVTTKHSLVAHTDCLVQLKLLLASRTATNETRRTVQLELSMGEFNEFFREMEKIANTLAIIN